MLAPGRPPPSSAARGGVRPGRALLAALALLALAPSTLPADLLVPRSGPKVTGRLVAQSEHEVVFNPWWSSNPAMTWEVLRLPADQVKKVEVEPHPEPEFYRRLRARKAGDAAGLLELAAWAKERRLKPHAEMAAALAAAEAPGDPATLAAAGGAARLAALARGNPLLDPALRKALAAYAAEPDAAARQAQAAALKAAGQPFKPEELERLRRSALLPKGLHVDVPLSLHSDRYPGAVYTLLVPTAYDPSVPWPLLIGLHGGGPDGKDGDEVVGSGDSAMNFYADGAERHGVITACPNAIVAGWGAKVNEDLVRDLIQELRLLYHVDVDRIHLTGHSMGGYGTWELGPRLAELLATVSPAAGAGGGGLARLLETRTPVFIYHSADDYIPVAPDRAAARQLREAGADFVYTELEKEGHGYPAAVRAELFEFLLPRRNADPAVKDAWPRSSLWGPAAGKVSADERTYLGDPLALAAVPDLEALVDAVRLGGGRARWAVARLGETRPAGAAEALLKVLKDEKVPPHARAEAARALGLVGDAAALPGLRRALALPPAREGSALAVAAARALAVLHDAEAGAALAPAVERWTAWLDGKRQGETLRWSDWQRGVVTLAELVSAWAATGGRDAPAVLERSVVARLFVAAPRVETSDRVPQDPGAARQALAKALGAAYAAGAAPPERWTALLEALAADPRARAAAAEARR